MFRKAMTFVVLTGLALAGPGSAATLMERTELVASTARDDARLPDPIDFQVTTAGNYVLTLQDLNNPAPLQSLRAIVTRNLQVVAETEVSYASATPTPATDTFAATPGAYRIHVLGNAQPGSAGGLFAVNVAAPDSTPIAAGSDAVLADPLPDTGETMLHETFDITAAGMYQLDLTDLAFPSALISDIKLLWRDPNGEPQIVIDAADVANSFTQQFPAPAGTYDLIIVATPSAGAGLYAVKLANGATIAHQSVNAVGSLSPPQAINFPVAGQYALTVEDKEFPVALSGVAVAIEQNGALIGNLATVGTSTITAAQGGARLFALGTPTDTGTFSVRIAQGANAPVYADVHIADASADSQTPAIFSASASQPVAAGAYRLSLVDFSFTAAIASLNAAVVQADKIVGRINKATELDATLQAGRVKVLVAASPPTIPGTTPAFGSGLFGFRLTAQPAGTQIFESTQGVGGLFRPMIVQIPAAGRYDITLADLKFPGPLAEGELAVTQGSTLVAQIYGTDVVPRQQLAAGTYVINFLGRPGANLDYGTYGLKVAESAAPPTVTLSASSATVTSGQRATLQWTATNATSCVAENGWSGQKEVTGTEQTQPLSGDTTFKIGCSGPGGAGEASVTVKVTAPSAKGGGGTIDILLLIYMSALSLLSSTRRR